MGRTRTEKVAKALAAKKNNKSSKNWALGLRQAYLEPHIEPYGDAVARGWTTEWEYLAKVARGFHLNFHWQLEDHEEPSGGLIEYDNKNPPPPEDLDEATEAKK